MAEETPAPAPSVRHTVSPSPSAEIETLVQGTGNYPDGVYTGSAQGYGGTVTVSVTVENGQIVSIEILSASGETDSFFARAKGVIDKLLTAQTWEVDGVSGATYSSDGIKGAVQQRPHRRHSGQQDPPRNVTGNSSALTIDRLILRRRAAIRTAPIPAPPRALGALSPCPSPSWRVKSRTFPLSLPPAKRPRIFPRQRALFPPCCRRRAPMWTPFPAQPTAPPASSMR